MNPLSPDKLKDRDVLVMGLGRFGGGLGVTRWLLSHGARVTLTDLEPAEKLAEPLAELRAEIATGRITLKLGGHDEVDFRSAKIVVINPAVPSPWNNRFVQAARSGGALLTTEIGLTARRVLDCGLRHRTIAVTGTVGKSTTTAMIAHALRSTGHKVLLGGNIGGTLLHELDRLSPDSPPAHMPWVVLELSSFQLHWLGEELADRFSPRVAVITNLAPNHLDWHGSMPHYAASKGRLLVGQSAGDTAIVGPGAEALAQPAAARGASVAPTKGESLDLALAVPGVHNRVNAQQALLACVAADAAQPRDVWLNALAQFPGLPHRLQRVVKESPWSAYNDSKSTTPEATMQAIMALSEDQDGRTGHLHLIAGGYDKRSDLTVIGKAAARLGGLYTIGATGPAIASAARAAGAATDRVIECGTLEKAVAAAWNSSQMSPGDVLLLSPGCASWDQFTNYEQRGELFMRLVRAAAERT